MQVYFFQFSGLIAHFHSFCGFLDSDLPSGTLSREFEKEEITFANALLN